uniref:ATP synthase F0 subunit 8 n=1 Tax=Lucernaria janetae TaxID=313506 RepID=G9IST6_LUCJA|nr:ATP synthase F0 subunit 8 [Lucernaria janetae]
MPQLDFVTFLFQFSGALLGLSFMVAVLIRTVLPGLKVSLRLRQQTTTTEPLKISTRTDFFRQILQSC